MDAARTKLLEDDLEGEIRTAVVNIDGAIMHKARMDNGCPHGEAVVMSVNADVVRTKLERAPASKLDASRDGAAASAESAFPFPSSPVAEALRLQSPVAEAIRLQHIESCSSMRKSCEAK